MANAQHPSDPAYVGGVEPQRRNYVNNNQEATPYAGDDDDEVTARVKAAESENARSFSPLEGGGYGDASVTDLPDV